MMNRYTVNFPTPERAIEVGVNLVGLGSRTLHFLNGMAFALKSVDSAIKFNVTGATPIHRGGNMDYRDITIESDSTLLVGSIRERLHPYGVTLTLTSGKE